MTGEIEQETWCRLQRQYIDGKRWLDAAPRAPEHTDSYIERVVLPLAHLTTHGVHRSEYAVIGVIQQVFNFEGKVYFKRTLTKAEANTAARGLYGAKRYS